MRKLTVMIGLAWLCGVSAAFAEEKMQLAAFEYPPIYQNAADKGLSGDIALAAFKAAGIDAELRFFPVVRMVEMVSSGQLPCAIGGRVLFEAPEVAEKTRVAATLQYVSQGFLYDDRRYPNGIVFSRLEDMSQYRIGVLFGSGIMRYLERAKGLRLDVNRTHDGSAHQLQRQRVDVWAIVDLTGLMHMQRLFPGEAAHYRYSKAFNLGDVSLICSRRLDPDDYYGRRFREGLAAIKKNGTYLKLMARYYGSKEKINPEALPDDMR